MKVEFNFFHDVNWSMYGTLQTLILLIVLLIGNKSLTIFDLQFLVLISVISMMNKADPLPRLLFISFLCLVLWPRDKYFFRNGLLTMIAGLLLVFMYPHKNWITKNILNTIPYKVFFYISVPLWMLWCIYLAGKKLIETIN